MRPGSAHMKEKAMAKKNTLAGKDTAPATDSKWEAEDALRTLTRAEEIKANPKLYAAAKAMASEKIEEMRRVSGKADDMAKRGLISEKERTKLSDKAKTSS